MADAQLGSSSYISEIERRFAEIYAVAEQARSKGIDPSLEPECAVTKDVAERVEKSVGPKGVASRIRELTETMPREEVAFKIAEEIVLGKFGLGGEEAAKNAIRTALSILDEGRTVSAIQGISGIRIKTNPDRSKYLAVYFAGPIRSAGGTEMGLTLVISDYVRRLMGLEALAPGRNACRASLVQILFRPLGRRALVRAGARLTRNHDILVR